MKKRLKSMVGIMTIVLMMCFVIAITAFANKVENDTGIPSLDASVGEVASPSEAVPPEEDETVEDGTNEDETVEDRTNEDEAVPVESRLARISTDSNAEFIPVEGVAWAVGDNAFEGEDYPGWITWNQDQLSEEQKSEVVFISVKIFQDGKFLERINIRWNEELIAGNMIPNINEEGEYTCRAVYRMTDNNRIPEDVWSDPSEPFKYKPIGKPAPTPTNLEWDKDGTMRWDDVSDTSNYIVIIYQKSIDGKYELLDSWTVFGNEDSLLDQYNEPKATYKFSVVSIGDLKTWDNGEESELSEPFFVGDLTEKADSIIDNIMNSGDVKNTVENTVLTEDELDVMKQAIQADPNVADNLKKLEEKYKSEAGGNCSITSNSGIVDGNSVSVIGGVLNGAESITFDPVNINKGELSGYRKVIGLNISLTGVASTGD